MLARVVVVEPGARARVRDAGALQRLKLVGWDVGWGGGQRTLWMVDQVRVDWD